MVMHGAKTNQMQPSMSYVAACCALEAPFHSRVVCGEHQRIACVSIEAAKDMLTMHVCRLASGVLAQEHPTEVHRLQLGCPFCSSNPIVTLFAYIFSLLCC